MAWSPPSRVFETRDLLPAVNQSDDPRIGSGRDNSTGGTLSHVSSSGSNSASLSSLGSTFVPVLIYSAVCLIIFFTLRRKCPRVYAPRTIPGIRLPEELSPPLPSGWVNWIKPFLLVPDAFVLNHCSLDGFFFLRYIKVLGIICLAGCCVAWPVLLPIHGTGGNHLSELDLLTIGNIVSPLRFYAHAVVCWFFFGFILFMVSRECVYYINLRQAYLMAPYHSHRLSARTVMFTCVPKRFLDERRIRKLFGDSVKNVWIPTNTRVLRDLVEEREQTAVRLEKAEIELIKKANAARIKQLGPRIPEQEPSSVDNTAAPEMVQKIEKIPTKDSKFDEKSPTKDAKFDEQVNVVERRGSGSDPGSSLSASSSSNSPRSPNKPVTVTAANRDDDNDNGDDDGEYTHPYGFAASLPDVRGSVAAQWIPADARPTHRPLANLGRKVDTIRWTRLRLKSLNAQIAKLRRRFRAGDGVPYSSLFVEFDSQADAQVAFQILAHHQPLHMSPRFIGIRPADIVWPALRMRWWERIIRRFLIMGLIAAGVVFWSIPAAFVGVVSNVQFLSTNVPFLHWIDQLPTIITGVIQGLLPALALSLLMAAVPIMLRACARAAGVPSAPRVELFTQHAYFVFQVVQVFIVTTLTSAASAALTQIIQDPLSIKDLLSQNLPKASNFYLSYITVQCLAGGAGGMVHLMDIFRHQILAKTMEHPRRAFKTFHKLKQPHWGSIFPVFTNMAVIAISYSCIAPLILLFAGLGMGCTYFVYKYNLLYTFDTDLDSQGLHYPRALMHLMVGLYLAEICLIGLFSLRSAIGPVVMMAMFLIFTGLVHISLNDAVSPLLYSLPRTLALEDQDLVGDDDPDAADGEGAGTTTASGGGGAASAYYDLEEAFGDEEAEEELLETTNRGAEGASGMAYSVRQWTKSVVKAKLKKEADAFRSDLESSAFARFFERYASWLVPDNKKKPNLLTRFLHPEVYEDFQFLRKQMLPEEPAPPPGYPEDYARRGYWPPEMWTPIPRLWIPRDDGRVSRQEVAHTRDCVPITDHGCWLDAKGHVVADLDAAPFKEPRILY